MQLMNHETRSRYTFIVIQIFVCIRMILSSISIIIIFAVSRHTYVLFKKFFYLFVRERETVINDQTEKINIPVKRAQKRGFNVSLIQNFGFMQTFRCFVVQYIQIPILTKKIYFWNISTYIILIQAIHIQGRKQCISKCFPSI